MMLATAFNRRGDLSKGESALQDALIVCEIMPQSFTTIDSICMLSAIQYVRGQLKESAKTLQRAFEISEDNVRRGGRRLPIQGFVHVYQSHILYEWNRLDEALIQVKLGLGLLEPWGYKDCVLVGLMSLAKIHLARREDQQALKTIEKAKYISSKLPYWSKRVCILEALLNASFGNRPVVSKWLTDHKQLFSQPQDKYYDLEFLQVSQILLYHGDIDEASNLLGRIIHSVEKSDSKDRLIRALILQAVALLVLGEQAAAMNHIRRAVELAEHGGYIRVFLNEGEPVARLLYQVVQEGVNTDYYIRLLDEFSKQEIPTSSAQKTTGELIEPLSDREIEVLGLIADGCSNQEIAQQLVLSISTIKSHAHHIFGKLGVKNRTEAVARARLLGILPSP
jgi:LuxR family maltose regulon positive regulatory protein